MSELESQYMGDRQDELEGGYADEKRHIEAARHEEDTEDKEIQPFLEAIYEFKMAANAAFREYYTAIHPKNTRGVEEYLEYFRAIQSLWNPKRRVLHTSLTAPYKNLPAEVQKTLQSMLDKIHSSNNPDHTYVSDYWIRRLFVECAGSTNQRSFEACKRVKSV